MLLYNESSLENNKKTEIFYLFLQQLVEQFLRQYPIHQRHRTLGDKFQL